MRTPAEPETVTQPEMYKLESEEAEMSADVNGVVLSSPHPEAHIFTNRLFPYSHERRDSSLNVRCKAGIFIIA